MVARDGRDFLVRVFAEFEVMECVALADGVARRPLEKQRPTQEKTRTLKNQGCGTRKPERRQTEEKSLTPEGASYKRSLAH